jgi:hypothetical protein
MALKDILTGPERAELQNIMRNEPVAPRDTISRAAAKALVEKGLVERYSHAGGYFKVDWERVKNGGCCGCDTCKTGSKH